MLNHTLPLGGMTAGFLLVDDQGRLYNHVPGSGTYGMALSNTFPSVYIQSESGQVFTRCLTGKPEGGDAPVIDGQPPCLEQDQIHFNFQYPNANFKLSDSDAPAAVTWTYFNPVIPYDQVASAMPVVLMSVRVENKTSGTIRASVLFTTDNLYRPDSALVQGRCGEMHAVRPLPTGDANGNFAKNIFRGVIAGLPPEQISEYGFNGIVFGERRQNLEWEPQFHACLLARDLHNAKIRVSEYNPSKRRDVTRFWKQFSASGKLPPAQITTVAPAGAVVVAISVPPGGSQRYDFALAWHVPEALGDKWGFGNAYARSFKNAQESANHALKHLAYMVSAVEKWQQRLSEPKLPADFGNVVIHCSRALTTHTRQTPKGGFVLAGGNNEPGSLPLPWDFLSAMAILVFAPHFHTLAIGTRLAETLAAVREKRFSDSAEVLCETAELLLSAYADVVFLGHRARMAEWLPSMHAIVEAVLDRPAGEYASSKLLASRFSIQGVGLWAAALNVMACMAREAGDALSEEKYRKLGNILSVRFDTELLSVFTFITSAAARGQAPSPAGILTDIPALAGPCFSGLLGFESVTALRKILALVAARLGRDSAAESGPLPSFRNHVLGVLIRLLFSREVKGDKAEVKGLLKDLGERYFGLIRGDQAGKILPSSETLSLWAVLQCVVGFHYDALHQTIFLRPAVMPRDSVQLPIFSSLALGSIVIKRNGDGGVLLIRFSVETPLTIRAVTLNVPMAIAPVDISCSRDDEPVSLQQEVTRDENATRVAITFKSPVKLSNTFTLRLREVQADRKQ